MCLIRSDTPPARRLMRGVAIVPILLALLAMLLGAARPAHAQNETLDLASFYQKDLRALAMGNAYGPIARGEGALLYNPAGLVQRSFDIKLDLSLVAEGEAGDFFSDTLDLLGSTGTSTEIQAYLDKYVGTTQFYRAQTFANAVANLSAFNIGLGAGVLNQTQFGFTFDDVNGNGSADQNDALTLDEDTLDLSVASFAFGIFDGQLLMGVTLKSFTFERKTATSLFSEIITTGNIELTTAGDSYDGSGYDVGFIWRQESFPALRAQWSLVANNVGGITLQSTNGPTLEVPATYNLGWAMNPELPWSPVHLLFSVELEDITGEVKVRDATDVDHDRSTSQRMRYGAELGFWETTTGNHLLSVRAGSFRGLSSFGAEMNLFSVFRLVYTRYEDDFGYDGLEDPHVFDAIQLTLGFGF